MRIVYMYAMAVLCLVLEFSLSWRGIYWFQQTEANI